MKKFFLLVCFFLLFCGVTFADAFHIGATGGDCNQIGVWDATRQTCTLSAPLRGFVYIDDDGITLDGANFGPATTSDSSVSLASGVFVTSHQNDTIENLTVSGGGHGVWLQSAPNTILNNVTSINNTYGFEVENSENVTIENSVVKDPDQYGFYADSDIKNLTLSNDHFNEGLPNNDLSYRQNFVLLFPLDQNDQVENLNIDQSNTVDGKTIYYFENQNGTVFDNLPNAGVFYCVNCQNITLASTTFDGAHVEKNINFYKTTTSTIENNTIKNGKNYGLYFYRSNGNSIINNGFYSDANDIGSIVSSQNIYEGNIFQDTKYPNPGIELSSQSADNLITHNSFQNTGGIDLIANSSAVIVQNNFFAGYNGCDIWEYGPVGPISIAQDLPIGGNYYESYHLPNQGCSDVNSDGLCDTAHDAASIYGSTETIDAYPWTMQNGWQDYKNATATDNVLFLPGIEASRLYQTGSDGSEKRLWEPLSDKDASKIELGEDGKPLPGDNIYTRDVIDQAYKNNFGSLGPNIYKSFLAELASMKSSNTIADYSAVAYDWRLSLDDILNSGTVSGTGDSEKISYTSTASGEPYVISELRRLSSTSKSGKVTIVAHSNGGLLAKALMARLSTSDPTLLSKIDKVIFVAVPQIGTPEALAGLLHGSEQAVPYDWLPLLLSQHEAREFAHNSEMAYNLLPSADYFTYVDTPLVTFDTNLPTWRTKYGASDGTYQGMIHSEELLQNFLEDTYGRVDYKSHNVETPDSLSSSLLTDAENMHSLLDNWTAPTTTQVFEIAGWGVPSTMSGITYRGEETECADVICAFLPDAFHISPDPTWTIDGDGVVVTPSALWMGGNGVKRYWVNLKKYNNAHKYETALGLFPFDHKDILEVGELDTFIQNIITDQSLATLPQYISDSQPIAGPDDRRLIFALRSGSLNVYDQDNNHTGISTTTGQMEENVPGTSVVSLAGRTYIFSDSASSTVRVIVSPNQNSNQNGDTTNSGGQSSNSSGDSTNPIIFNIQQFSGDTLLASTTFEIIGTASTTAEIVENGNDISSSSPLIVDLNGDGQTDLTLAPKINDTVVFVTNVSTSSEATTTDTTAQATTTEDENTNETTTTDTGGGSNTPATTTENGATNTISQNQSDVGSGIPSNGPIIVTTVSSLSNNPNIGQQNLSSTTPFQSSQTNIQIPVNPPVQSTSTSALQTNHPVLFSTSTVSAKTNNSKTLLAQVSASGFSLFQLGWTEKLIFGAFVLLLLFVILYVYLN